MKTSNTSSPQQARLYTANILHHFPLHFFFAGAFAWLLWSGAAPGSSAETMLAITVQPTDQYDCTSNMASFSITATGASSYQWFRSSDEGANWIPLGNGDYGLLAGVNTPTLTASGGSLVLINGLLFRCQVSDGSTTLNSAAARFQIGLPATSIQYGHTGYCTGAGPVAVVLTGAQGGTFTASPAGLSIHAANGQITPGSSTPNTYTVTYHVPAQHGCAAINATTVVSISTNVQPVISYGAAPLCHHETSVPVSLSGAGGGTFSSSAGLSVNSATGAINPSASTPGTYTVTYTTSGVAATGCTAYMATTNVTINNQLNATITGGGNHNCAGGSYNLTVTGTPNSIVTYKINGGDDLTLTIGGSGTTVLNTGSLRENTSYQLVSVRFADTEFCARPLSSTANLTFNRPYLTYAVSAPATANEGEVVNIDITNRPFTIILYQINGGLVQSALINNSTGLISIPVTVNGTTTFTRFSSSYQSSPTCSTTYPDSAAVVISVAACPPVGTIWYVDASAAPGGTGSSWTCAFQNLQDAINAASSGDEIWVKAGTYKPTAYPVGCSGCSTARDYTFYLKDGVAIYGGFAGMETMRSQRNWTANVTTLSGDIGAVGDNSDNAHHVVLSGSNASTTVLDGFTVEKGNADGTGSITVGALSIFRNQGGGLQTGNSSMAVTGCTFSQNTATNGGGMYNFASSPTLTNCTFSGNSAGNDGGGLNILGSSSPSLTDCTFSSNSAGDDGGGLSSGSGTSPSLTNCTFTGNSASSSGGALLIVFSTTSLTDCTFSSNSAGDGGGGIYMSAGSATVSKCVFSGNSSIAVFISQASPVFTDCLFTGNSSFFQGGGLYTANSAAPSLTNCTFSGNNAAGSSGGGIYSANTSSLTLTNCLLWNNRANGVTGSASANLHKIGSAPVITYSLIQNHNPSGTGNLNGVTNAANSNYPNFLTPLDPATAPSTSGNFRLSDCSPAANAGNNVGVSATDLDGNPRIFNSAVDIGAYERQTNGTAPATWYADADGDTFGNPAVSVVSCHQPAGYVSNNLDCDDTNNALNPNTVWYLDADGDGYYTGTGVTQCASPGAGYRYTGILGGGDCNDDPATGGMTNPGATEICNGIDDNCNGMTDEGLSFVTYYQDSDGDTFGNPAVSQSTCDGPPAGYVSNNLDCNDSNSALNPNTIWYLDADGDGYYIGTGVTQCASPGAGYRYTGILGGGDCNDGSAAVNPGASEICNGIDDNCNGMTDEGVSFVTYYQDSDGDTFGNPAVSQSTCDGPPTGYVSNNLDCDDSNNALNPNTVWYLDADGDNYYTGTGVTQCTSPGAGYRYTGLTAGGDCNDDPATGGMTNPGATEICNGIDDDCDGTADDGITFVTYYQDSDGDTFGNPAVSQSTCDGPPTGYVSNNLDCDDSNNALNPNTVWYLDADGDGYYTGTGVTQCASPGAGYRYTGILGGGDCNDSNPAIHPGAAESCNGIDDNCNSMIDDGLTFVTYYQDSDGDTFGNPAVSQSTCDGPPAGYVSNNLDCNDGNNALNPNAVWYLDADGDGYYTGAGVTQCASPGAGYRYTGILGGGDCNDGNAAIHPGATEICNGVDDNCNGMTDEGISFVTYYQDNDGDTFGNPAVSQSTCDGPPAGYVSNSLDCDDTNNTLNPNTVWYLDADGDGYYTGTGVTQCASPGAGYRYTGILGGGDCNDDPATGGMTNPGATEICNGIDDDCDSTADDGITFVTYYQDSDGDTFGNPAVSQSTCDGPPTGYVSNNLDCDDSNNALNPNTVWYLDADGDGYYTGTGVTQCASPGAGYRYTGILGGGDCNDGNAAIHPGATEICNGIDDNCNSMIDDGLTFVTYYQDSDGDTFGNPAVSQSTCDGPPTGYVSNNLDCNDSNNALNPNTVWYLDADGDNYYTGTGITQCVSPGIGYRYTGLTAGGDCNDGNAAIYPGATETCNGIDDNCNSMIDDGLTFVTYYQDSDGDTFGNPAVSQSTCDGPPTGYVSNNLDCDDSNNALNPNTVWYLDADGDNYYTGTGVTQCTSPGAGYRYTGILGGGDCNDDPATGGMTNPGATEICNGIDDDCDGTADDGITFVTYYQDSDGDTFGNPAVSQSTCDGPPTGYVSNNLDCDDSNNALNPNTVWYLDADGDGYYTGTGVTQCASPGAGYRYTGILGGGDCNDSNAAIHPGATETCNGIDDNCNSMIDDGLTFVTYYQDSDGDTFGNPAVSQSTCDGPPTGYVSNNLDCDDSNNALNPNTVWYLDADGDNYYTGTGVTQCASPGAGYRYTGILGGGDCDDSNPAIHPGAAESCNGIDDNCNGMTDEGVSFVTYYQDNDGDTFGNPAVSQSTCDGPPTGYVSNNLDCDDSNNALNPNTVWYLDADGDGYYTGTGATQCASPGAGYRYTGLTAGGDCNDDPATGGMTNPGATEICNGIDDDCDGTADDGITFVTYYQDSDGDTFGNPAVSQSTCDGPPAGYVSNNLDCNDSNNALNPNTVWYLDADGDGYYTGTGATQCASPGTGYRYTGILGGGDCNDGSAAVNPDASEICNSIDDNCNGMTDEGISFVTYYQDSDGDTFGNPAVSQSTCDGPPAGYVSNSLDCDDTNNTLNPNTVWYLDADGDGYYTGTGVTQCASPGAGYRYTGILGGGDCNDGNAAIHPGATEICNGVDDNCNGMTDEGISFVTYYQDSDGDTFGNPAVSQSTCDGPPTGYVSNNLDCNDSNNALNPNTVWYLDADGDNYYTGTGITQCVSPGIGYRYTGLTAGGDCNDGNAAIYPGATETCNGIDDNCNSMIDDGLTFVTYYQDSDGDTFGNPAVSQSTCDGPPTGYVSNNLDCDDSNNALNPNTVWYLDADGDNYYTGAGITQCASPGAGYRYTGILGGGDCNDDPATGGMTNPGATEICNGIDDDCDGLTDIDDLDLMSTPLQMSCPAAQTLPLNSTCSATLPDYRSLANLSGGCGTVTVTQMPLPGTSVSQAGSMIVTIMASDQSGNMQSCTLTVNKLDVTPPSVTCFNGSVVFNGQSSIALDADALSDASDNCGVQSISLSPTAIFATQVGQNVPVTVTVTDLSGNTASCISTVSVSGLPEGWSQTPNGVGCVGGNSNTYNPATGEWTATSTNCFYGPPFTQDASSFAQRRLCGDGSITVQVTSIVGGGWAGVAMRESNAPGAKKAQLLTNLGQYHRREFRTATNGVAQPQQISSNGRHWLRIVRTGNQFTLYASGNGTSWFIIGAQNIVMSNCIELGLVATNQTANSSVTATFANMSFSGSNSTLGSPLTPHLSPLTPLDSPLTPEFDVYPNPTGGELNVDLTQYVGRDVRIEVYSIEGKLLQFREIEEVQTTMENLNLSQYAGGMYFVKIKSHDLPDATRRVVLQRE